ncbi:LemA family protein [Kaustia mangrovi]|uniref:LemA family protein n=1 Tax=Kaustia mangrovi TaxID=2593653 RepID=A0A7S8C400_9HYPH|nr:LemA family protein [Kaustia mangrovi]QPC42941.1 LemA family protein [Kaustia mangrovi]
MPTSLIAIVLIAAAVFAYIWYATLIRRRNKAQEALSSIDVQLRKRHDLLPNVLKLADRFMAHERDLLARVTALRNDAQKPYDPSKGEEVRRHLESEGALQSGLRQLFAVAENYPDLRSSETVLEAQRSFNEVEGHIAAARRFYNAAVTSLNTAIQIPPGSLIAAMARVEPMPFFEIEDEAARQPVDADAYLSRAPAD